MLQISRKILQFYKNPANFTKIPKNVTILQKFRKFDKNPVQFHNFTIPQILQNSAKFRVETWDTKQMRR